VYGPRQDPSSPYSCVISIVCERLLREQPIDIFGDGSQTRDFVFVSDVVTALLAAMRRAEECSAPISAVYNVCTGAGTSVLDLAHFIGEICGREPQIRHREPRYGEIAHSCGARALIVRELELGDTIELRSGLSETISWMRMSAGSPIQHISRGVAPRFDHS